MHLTQAQLFYFNDEKQQAYRHLELQAQLLLLQAMGQTRMRPFQLRELQGRINCGRTQQKLIGKNEHICNKVLCPLFGYWYMAKKH